MFPDEDACYAWLEATRWHGTPVCPHCGGIENISRPPSNPPPLLAQELPESNRTAYHMLHRIREACGNGDFTLAEIVEADETHIGGK